MKIVTKNTPPAKVTWGLAPSPAGKLVVGLTDKGQICRIAFLRKNRPQDIAAEWQNDWPKTAFTKGVVPKNFETKPIVLVGTDFQQAVWRSMAKIPAGYVTTYGEIARHIRKPKSSRAVGAACGANPVPYLVPCHRVVSSNGLGGFSSGLDIKKKLLKSEQD